MMSMCGGDTSSMDILEEDVLGRGRREVYSMREDMCRHRNTREDTSYTDHAYKYSV